jgi:hypothetical protein
VLDKCDERNKVLGGYFGSRSAIIEVDRLTLPSIENGTRTDNPNVATHKKPKKPVMIFELS